MFLINIVITYFVNLGKGS